MPPEPIRDHQPSQVLAPQSCIECRRLKRKCNRLYPCDICTRHGKQCAYKEVQSGSGGTKTSRPSIKSPIHKPNELSTINTNTNSTRLESTASPGSISFRTTPSPATSLDPPLAHSPPVAGPSTFRGSYHEEPTWPTHAAPPPPAPAPPPPQSNTEALERQPRNASGYEWNERETASARGNDGTASLSVEPDGEGYLGFASGATLLRILQLCAGAVSLSQVRAGEENSSQEARLDWRPTHADLDVYLNGYFQLYHVQYPLIHEPTFRAQYAEVVPRPPPRQWDLLLNIVLGLGAFCTFEPVYKIDYFLERASSLISVEQLASGSLTLVQSFCLLSNLAQRRNQPNSAWTYIGIAMHMSCGLGLHRELPSWNITPFEREVRRRIWWCVYCFHSGASMTFGRPMFTPEGEADVKMVSNVVDRVFTPSTLIAPIPSPDATLYTSLIHQASFHLVGNGVYRRVISSPPPGSSFETLALDSELQSWYSTLPDSMKPYSPARPWLNFTAQKLFWRYANLRIILHRRAFLERVMRGLPLWSSMVTSPGPNPSSVEEADAYCSDLCLQNASDTIGAINQFFATRHPNRLEWWYGLHYLFHASFVPLIALHADPASHRRTAWQEDVDRARNTLQALKEDPLADRCLQIVNLLVPSPSSQAVSGSNSAHTVPDNTFLTGVLNMNPTDDMDLNQDWLPFIDYTSLTAYLRTNGVMNQ